VPFARPTIVLGVFATAALLAGCGGFDDPAAAQGVTRNDLIAELAAQLGGSASLTFVATYQLAGGTTGTITQAQGPPRAAYRYPGGEVLLTAAATIRCAKATCTMTAPAPPNAPPAPLLADAQRAGLVAPAAVVNLLNTAALDADLTVEQHDTTIAGRHANCVELGEVDGAQAGEFSACITNDGVLGSFTGTLNGKAVDVAMTDFADRVATDAFGPPRNATMIDRR
jgi:hypothetical protein